MFGKLKNVKRALLTLMILGLSPLVMQVSAAPAEKDAKAATDTSPVIMKINGKAVTQAQLDRLVAQQQQMQMQQAMMQQQQGGQGGQMPQMTTDTTKLRSEAKEKLIGITLMQQAIDKQLGNVKDAAMDAELAKIKKDMEKEGEKYEEFLKKSGMSEADLKGKIREHLAMIIAIEKEAGSVNPTEKEMQDTYEKFKGQMEQVRASHILIGYNSKPGQPPSAPSDKEKAELKKKAEEVLKKVKSGGDFAKLAKEYSTDKGSAEKGGDLDYFGHGKMVPAFEEAAFSLKVGEVSGLVESPFGFHIIKVTDIKKPTYEEMKDRIKERMMMNNMMAKAQLAVGKLRTEAKIEDLDKKPAASAEKKSGAKKTARKKAVKQD